MGEVGIACEGAGRDARIECSWEVFAVMAEDFTHFGLRAGATVRY